jgi:hypothetical protein
LSHQEIRKTFVMKSAPFVQALVVAVLLGAAVWAPGAEPGDSYQNASVLCQDGMKAMEAGHRETAMGKLKAAQTLIQKISHSQPHWQPALVAYRLQKIENVLKELSLADAQALKSVSAVQAVVTPP